MISRYFQFEKMQTTLRQEVIGGLTTFMTMAYIIVVNPKILEAGGFPFEASMAATIWTAFIGTLLMGVYAKRPFAIAPYMGENAFIAYTVVKVMGFSWQVALGGIFLSGLLFALMTVTKLRGWLIRSIPMPLKAGFSVGIGLFLAFIGLTEMGMVQLGVPGAPVRVGNFHDPSVILGAVSFLFMASLLIRKIPGAFIIGMLTTTFMAMCLGLAPVPKALVSLPPNLTPLLGQLDIQGALSPSFASVLLTLFVILFIDTMGTLIGVSYQAGFLDSEGQLPEVEKPMLCDSLSTMVGAVLGTTASGAYIESASGIEAGGKTGFSSIIVAALFLSALFFAPLFSVIPAIAYGPVLVLVGLFMLKAIQDLDFTDLTQSIPVFCIIILMSFTYNMGIGLTVGFIVYPLLKVLSGKSRDVSAGLWILFALALIFFMAYPF